MTTKKPRRSNSFSSKVQRLLEQGRTPKEIAKILKCEPTKVYNAKWYLNKKSGIAALPAKKPIEPARVVIAPIPEAKPVPSPYEEAARSTTMSVVVAVAVTAVIAVLVAVFA